MMGHNSSVLKVTKIENTQSCFSDNSALKVEVKHKYKARESSLIWKLNILSNHHQLKEEVIKDIIRILKMKMKI